MLGKNNEYERRCKNGRKIQSFGIRKYKIGVVSVAFASSILFALANAQAYAEEVASAPVSNESSVEPPLDSAPEIVMEEAVSEPPSQEVPVEEVAESPSVEENSQVEVEAESPIEAEEPAEASSPASSPTAPVQPSASQSPSVNDNQAASQPASS